MSFLHCYCKLVRGNEFIGLRMVDDRNNFYDIDLHSIHPDLRLKASMLPVLGHEVKEYNGLLMTREEANGLIKVVDMSQRADFCRCVTDYINRVPKHSCIHFDPNLVDTKINRDRGGSSKRNRPRDTTNKMKKSSTNVNRVLNFVAISGIEEQSLEYGSSMWYTCKIRIASPVVFKNFLSAVPHRKAYFEDMFIACGEVQTELTLLDSEFNMLDEVKDLVIATSSRVFYRYINDHSGVSYEVELIAPLFTYACEKYHVTGSTSDAKPLSLTIDWLKELPNIKV